jgi:hypothetical protein
MPRKITARASAVFFIVIFRSEPGRPLGAAGQRQKQLTLERQQFPPAKNAIPESFSELGKMPKIKILLRAQKDFYLKAFTQSRKGSQRKHLCVIFASLRLCVRFCFLGFGLGL